MATSWRGDEAKLQQLCHMFAAASNPDQQVQQQVLQMLTSFSQLPDFNMYLVAVFAQVGQPEIVRQRAGLVLKNNVTNLQADSLAPGVADHINEQTLAAMHDSSRTIRQTAGTILTTMVQKLGLSACGPNLEKLVEMCISSQVAEVKEGCLSALGKICEDEMVLLAAPSTPNCQLFMTWSNNRLLPHVFECATPSAPLHVRKEAVELLNHFALNNAFCHPQIPNLHAYSMKFIDVLGVLANDESPEILKPVCKGFASIVENTWPCLKEEHYDIILKFMLKASQNPEYAVRYEALAVWSNPPWDAYSCLHSLLPQLVPVLLENMVYSNADYMCLEPSQLEDDNAANPDSLEAIKPRFHKDDKNIDGEDDEEDAKSSTWGTDWTARKAAASALDQLSGTFDSDVANIVLPIINTKLQDSRWDHQEAGVLAIGAIGVNLQQHLTPYMDKILEMLLGLATSPKPLIRSISCWTLSRFSSWICPANRICSPAQQQMLGPVIKTLLQRCLDRNKCVQEAACSAFAQLEESALTLLAPFISDIVQTFVAAFQLYQTKNLRHLYDAVGTFAWAVGPEFDKPQYVEALMLPIMQRFGSVADNDITTVAMFECCSHIVQTIGASLAKVIPTFVQRCLAIIPKTAQAARMWEHQPNEFERPDWELMAASVDLLAGILEGLGDASKEVIAQQNFLLVLSDTLKTSSQRVKQSGFALMGTAATKCIENLAPLLPELFPLCAAGLEMNMLHTVSNNASWAIGEVCVRVGPDFMSNYLDLLVPPLGRVLCRQNAQIPRLMQGLHQLKSNVAITMGRLGIVNGDKMGKFLPGFMMQWCQALYAARPDEEKMKALQGLCNMIKANSEPGLQCFPQLAAAVASVPATSPFPNVAQYIQHLQPQFKEILHGYKQAFGTRWPEICAALPGPPAGKGTCNQQDILRLQRLYELGM